MAFVFDSQKSRRNLAKHGISFLNAQRLWDDPKLLEARARAEDEPRTIAIGMIGELRYMKAKQLDKDFDEGKDISAALDLSSARRPNQKRVNVDFPNWMVEMLDKEAMRLGVTRQSIIKIWLAERLEQLASFQSMQSDEKKTGHL